MTEVNCAEACKNGCVLGDECPHREYVGEAASFIANTSLDQMLQISQDRFIKQMEADAAKVDAMMPELPELKLPEGF